MHLRELEEMLGDAARMQQRPVPPYDQEQEQAQRQSPVDPSASLLAVDVQQIAFALGDDDDRADARRDSSKEDSNGAQSKDCDRRLDHKQQHGSAKHSVLLSSSNDAHRVMPDLRDEEHFDPTPKSLGNNRVSDITDHHIQECATVDTNATVPVSAASDSSTTHHGMHDISNGDGVRASPPAAAEVDRSSILSADLAIWNIVQLLRPSTGMDKQIYMSLGALVLSLVLGACALCFRDEIFDATHVNAGLLLGSAGTLAMCSVIIGTYLTTKWYRRHMHILLLNLAVFDLLLALSFVLEPAWRRVGAGVGAGLTCRWLSIVREYLIMCSTTWTMCMALDLYYLMTDPFTSPRMNRRKYQLIVHASASAGAIIMGASSAFDAPVAVGNFCWVGAQHENQNDTSVGRNGIWIFIIAPVTLSMGANIFVTFVSYGRFRDGISATLKTRHVLLREGFLTTVTVIVYSALLWGVYGGYWVATSETQTQVLSHLFAFLLSYRGSVAFILWCLYKRPRAAAAQSKLRKRLRKTVDERGRRSSTDPDDERDDENDDAVRPQMNIALLQELVAYTTEGIAHAVRNARSYSPADDGACTFTLRPSGSDASWSDCQFTDYHPLAFLRIRQLFGIDEDAYLSSLASCTTPKVSEGASGSFMFYSRDRSYIVKSLSSHESSFLHSFLDAYVAYMTAQRSTFLTRFLGSYCIVLYGKRAHFVVMENVFDIQHGVSIHQRYDIKGSWIDRNAQKAKRGSETTCRHCNLTFRCGVGRNVCPNRAGSHEPNVVLKDMDLTTKLRFGKIEGKKLVHQLKRDSNFLCDQGIMDYSLLLGVIEVSYQVNQQNILTRDGSIFLDNPVSTATRSERGGSDDVVDTSTGTETTTTSKSSAERVKQSTQCLRTSEVVIGPGFYYIGIIDILQTWNLAKRFERFVKTVILRKDPDGISAMAPKPYRTRFHKKLDEIIHLGHNSIVLPSPKNRLGSGTAQGGAGLYGNSTSGGDFGSSRSRDDCAENYELHDMALSASAGAMAGQPTNALVGVPSLTQLSDSDSARDGGGEFVQGQVRRGSVFLGELLRSESE